MLSFPEQGTDLGLTEEVITQCCRGSLSDAHQGARRLLELVLRIAHCSTDLIFLAEKISPRKRVKVDNEYLLSHGIAQEQSVSSRDQVLFKCIKWQKDH